MIAAITWGALDAWTVLRRYLIHWVRQPASLGFALAFPVLIAVMFGYLLGGAMTVPGGGDYRAFLVPGMFAMTVVFDLSATVTAMNEDARRGVTDRFRSMPMARSAVILGRGGADLLQSVLVIGVLAGVSALMGWRPNGGVGATVLAFGLLMLFRFALLWIGITIALAFPGPSAVTALAVLEFPVGFLANTFVAPSTMPGWLGAIAAWNPLSSTVGAMRELFGSPGAGGDSWPATHPVPLAIAIPLVLTAIFLPWSVRLYRRLSR